MAFASLFTLPDDITAVLDDVALMTKAAAKKTAGVVGDDLALNANRVTGVSAERELPIVWSVAKGSFSNKPVLVPAALLLSAFLPQLITPLLTAGGIYLCFEGVEKLLHKFLHRHDAHARNGGNRHRHDCFGVRNRRRHRQTRRLRHAADAPPTSLFAQFGANADCLYALLYPRFERGRHACHVSCRRRTGRPQPRPSARFPARATLGRWLGGVLRQPRCRAAFRFDCLRPRLAADESFRQALIPFSNTDAV